MLNLSAALGRLVLSGRELARLSGFSSRVTGLIDVIDQVNRGVHRKRGHQSNVPGGSSRASAAGGGASVNARATDASDAAAARAAEVEEKVQKAANSSVARNAGVAGVNLATVQTPLWTPTGRKEVPTETAAVPSPISPIIDDPSSTTATADETSSVTGGITDFSAAGTVAGESHFGVGLTGQPELAPENGSSGRGGGEGGDGVAAAAATGGGRIEPQVSSDGAMRVVGGAQLSRSGSVVVNKDWEIEFQDVPLVTPTGEVLIEALSFKVKF